MIESSNSRPGEPLRSWLSHTDVVTADAIFTVRMAGAKEALERLIAGESLSPDDQIALGRLNSYCVARWYEPMVALMHEVHIDPDVAQFLSPLLVKSAAPS